MFTSLSPGWQVRSPIHAVCMHSNNLSHEWCRMTLPTRTVKHKQYRINSPSLSAKQLLALLFFHLFFFLRLFFIRSNQSAWEFQIMKLVLHPPQIAEWLTLIVCTYVTVPFVCVCATDLAVSARITNINTKSGQFLFWNRAIKVRIYKNTAAEIFSWKKKACNIRPNKFYNKFILMDMIFVTNVLFQAV